MDNYHLILDKLRSLGLLDSNSAISILENKHLALQRLNTAELSVKLNLDVPFSEGKNVNLNKMEVVLTHPSLEGNLAARYFDNPLSSDAIGVLRLLASLAAEMMVKSPDYNIQEASIHQHVTDSGGYEIYQEANKAENTCIPEMTKQLIAKLDAEEKMNKKRPTI